MQKLPHSAEQVRKYARDRFYSALFVPPPVRRALLALYALEVELEHVHGAVSEEMIGHIRYAWWQEALEGLYAGHPPRGHPVLEELVPVIAHLPKEALLPLVESYRAAFPNLPADAESIMEGLSLTLLRSLSPTSEKGWRKAYGIIQRHRARHGSGKNSWLVFKLLILLR